jgi:hypothetical protein
MTFAGFMFGRLPSAAQMAVSDFRIDDPRSALEAEFTELLAGYLVEHRSLTAWDCHCLANAMRLMCLGLYGQAFEQITQIRCPPIPMPTFRVSEPLTFEVKRSGRDCASAGLTLPNGDCIPVPLRMLRAVNSAAPADHSSVVGSGSNSGRSRPSSRYASASNITTRGSRLPKSRCRDA